jgi:hypothetical protein
MNHKDHEPHGENHRIPRDRRIPSQVKDMDRTDGPSPHRTLNVLLVTGEG